MKVSSLTVKLSSLNIIEGCKLFSKSAEGYDSISEMVKQQVAEQINENKASFVQDNTVEEIKMAKMNANYEHDKAVLAKEDPMFAKNKFWDVGHAEGSGELDRNSYNNMLNKVKEEYLMKLDEKNEQK